METMLQKPTTTEHVVLGLLASASGSGYELQRRAKSGIAFLWSPAQSHTYRVLPRLAARGLASAREVAQRNRPDKQVYAITREGRRVLREWLNTVEEGDLTLFLLKIFFGEHAPSGAAEHQVTAYRQELLRRIDEFEEIERRIATDPEELYADLTLRHGLARARAGVQWADETLQTLRGARSGSRPREAKGRAARRGRSRRR